MSNIPFINSSNSFVYNSFEISLEKLQSKSFGSKSFALGFKDLSLRRILIRDGQTIEIAQISKSDTLKKSVGLKKISFQTPRLPNADKKDSWAWGSSN